MAAKWWLIATVLFTGLGTARPAVAAETLDVQPGDKIVIIGNTLAERMATFGRWEPLLHSRFPQHQLEVRNLGWSADEIDLRPRSKDFDDHGHTLRDHAPDVVIAMFGLNESFAGAEGLDAFRQSLDQFITETTSTAYNGEAPPKLVLCSPTPHEDLGRPELPNGTETNANIRMYMSVMGELADQHANCFFVDLYTPMLEPMADPETDLTINGIHLNDDGYRELAQVLDRPLFAGDNPGTPAQIEKLRDAVVERNRQFYYDYRAVNGYYIYGGRKNPYGVINFPAEFAKLRKMIAVRDQRIWDIAAGKPVSDTIDDSQTGDLPAVETNVATAPEISTPEESLRQFTVPDGFTVELVASEVEFPDLENPVAFEFDNRGRLWVSTMPSYPMYLPGTPPNDKILIFEDSDGDGRMDKQTVFADGLHLPIGFVLGDGGAYVSAQPNLLFLQDTDGDDVADVRRTILHGFDSADSHHSISAFTWGPGGAMYFQEGTFHHTQVETPYGPRRVKDAAVFRYEPKTEKFDIFVSYPFANPWGHCFDRWGQNFVADASGGANYYGTAFSGDVVYPNKRRGMEQFLVKQWRPTCGCVTVSSRNFPDEMQGDYLLNNTIGFLGTLQYRFRDDGSGFAADPVTPLVQSSDPNFRPVDLAFGPDGALYLVDWFNPLIGHMQHSLRDPNRDQHHGRIWRVRNTRKRLVKTPPIAGEPVENLVPLLGAYEDTVRGWARNELRLHDTEKVMEVLGVWLDSLDATGALEDEDHVEHAHLEALWVAQHHDHVDRNALLRVLRSRDPRARAAAVRVLSYWRDRIEDTADLLIAAAADDHPRVRLEAVRAASFLDADAGRQIVDQAMSHPLDYYLNYTIGETTTTLDRKFGAAASGPNDLYDQLASSLVAQPQLVSSIRNAARSADAGQIGRIVSGVLKGPYESTVKTEALDELIAAVTARKLTPGIDAQAFVAAFDDAVKSERPRWAATLAQAAGDWQVLGIEESLRRVVFDDQADGPLVQRSLEALAKFDTPTGTDAISSLNRQPIPLELKLRAAAALVPRREANAAKMLKEAVGQPVDDYPLIKNVVDAWASQSGGLDRLAKRLQGVDIEINTAKLMLRALNAAGDTTGPLVDMLRSAAGVDANRMLTPAEKAALVALIDSEGDPVAGQSIFRRESLQCVKCHALSGAGGNVGPDLSGVGATSPTEYLLDSILLPSQQIKEAYATIRVLTYDGKIEQGVKVERDDVRLILRDADLREVTIPIDDIEAESEGASLMPAGIHELLTERELVDLVAFLGALGKPGPFAVNTSPTIQRYQVLVDPKVKAKLAAMDEGAMEGQLQQIADDAWRSVYALVDGRLPLDELSDDAASNPVILRGEIDVITPGRLGFDVQPPVDVQLVAEGRSISPGDDQIEMDAGRRRIYLIFERGMPSRMITTRVVKPEGSRCNISILGGP
jgi:putative heme-binding domain-containing protein